MLLHFLPDIPARTSPLAWIEELGLDNGQWELFAVSDNAANVKLGIRLSEHLKQYFRSIHTLELGVKDTFKNVPGMKSVVKKTKAIGKYTHKSTEANKALKREAKKENINFRKIVNPPNTRWSGYHDNLASVLYLNSAHADGGPRSRVCARETLRSAPHRCEQKFSSTHVIFFLTLKTHTRGAGGSPNFFGG